MASTTYGRKVAKEIAVGIAKEIAEPMATLSAIQMAIVLAFEVCLSHQRFLGVGALVSFGEGATFFDEGLKPAHQIDAFLLGSRAKPRASCAGALLNGPQRLVRQAGRGRGRFASRAARSAS